MATQICSCFVVCQPCCQCLLIRIWTFGCWQMADVWKYNFLAGNIFCYAPSDQNWRWRTLDRNGRFSPTSVTFPRHLSNCLAQSQKYRPDLPLIQDTVPLLPMPQSHPLSVRWWWLADRWLFRKRPLPANEQSILVLTHQFRNSGETQPDNAPANSTNTTDTRPKSEVDQASMNWWRRWSRE